ncbi:MAG: undecaprenyl/decaprenyl-phosphate alpha-N-acetylglucosaminyl 1-phosphate transferase [Proteobacteria bacterium]|nr:undecaprenyl/decaprenyl-phosphate alpha-N-acetylglucosaminyl 1-phosphate transferase [Pseudomonadota bacterium]
MVPILAVALCLIASWLILRHAAPIANRLGLIDRPTEARKIHARPTPRMGGLAFIVALAISAGLSAIDREPDRVLLWGSGLVAFHFIMGAIDDHRGLPAAWRLLGSIVACGLTLACNDELVIGAIRLSAGVNLEIPHAAALILTTLGIVFFIFSVNLMDGRNGILGVNGLWWLALLQASTNMLPMWAFLAAAVTLLAFLRFNLRGLLFAGDGGAYVVGSGIAVLALAIYARRPDTMAFDQLMVLFLLPVLDAARVLIRRTWLHMMPFQADNSHLHHVLWRRAGDRGAARLYTAAIIGPSTLAALLPSLALPILGAAIGFFFMLVYWPTEPVRASARSWRYVRSLRFASAQHVTVRAIRRVRNRG